MEDLILYGTDRKKQAIIHDFIEFDCACGRNAYSDNDFVLKTPFDRDNLIEVGQWVSYGQTEYGGIIRTREIDVGAGTVTYSGSTFRGILAHILARSVSFPSTGGYTGKPASLMNAFLSNFALTTLGTKLKDIYEAESEIDDTAEVGIFSTSGLPFTNFLYLHDNIVKRFTTVLGRPIKSRFSFRNGEITISFVDGNIYHYDSSRVRLKYAENKNNPNLCVVMTRKEEVCHYSEIDGSLLYREWVFKEGRAFLDENGDATNDRNAWCIDEGTDTDIVCLVCESTGEGTTNETGDYPLDKEAVDRLNEAQEKPSIEVYLDTDEAEIDDLVVASISELKMKVSKKVVETHLKVSNGIPTITYTLEG